MVRKLGVRVMNCKKLLLLGLFMSLSAMPVQADDDIFANEGVTSFQQNENAWRRTENETQPQTRTPVRKEILPEILSAIGPVAWDNIKNAEKIFCYEVASRPDNYDGYSIDSMAITGFCGVIKDEVKNIILSDLFMNNKNVLFNVREECVIRPRIVLRFVKGIDATDILLSSPCYSFTVYYPGMVKVFNAKPAAKIIDTVINTLNKNRVDFISPALLNQLLPVGVPQTPEQRELVSKRAKPIRNWTADKPKEATPAPAKKGWNNLDIGF